MFHFFKILFINDIVTSLYIKPNFNFFSSFSVNGSIIISKISLDYLHMPRNYIIVDQGINTIEQRIPFIGLFLSTFYNIGSGLKLASAVALL